MKLGADILEILIIHFKTLLLRLLSKMLNISIVYTRQFCQLCACLQS